MEPNFSGLVAALPDDLTPPDTAVLEQSLEALLHGLAKRPVPEGRLTRMWTMGTLKGKTAIYAD